MQRARTSTSELIARPGRTGNCFTMIISVPSQARAQGSVAPALKGVMVDSLRAPGATLGGSRLLSSAISANGARRPPARHLPRMQQTICGLRPRPAALRALGTFGAVSGLALAPHAHAKCCKATADSGGGNGMGNVGGDGGGGSGGGGSNGSGGDMDNGASAAVDQVTARSRSHHQQVTNPCCLK